MEEYEFRVVMSYSGCVSGYSLRDAAGRIKELTHFAVDDFGGSLVGSLNPVEINLDVWTRKPVHESRSDPQEPSIVLPNVMDWLP